MLLVLYQLFWLLHFLVLPLQGLLRHLFQEVHFYNSIFFLGLFWILCCFYVGQLFRVKTIFIVVPGLLVVPKTISTVVALISEISEPSVSGSSLIMFASSSSVSSMILNDSKLAS